MDNQNKQEKIYRFYNFLRDGNGILCCYNMFPTQFGKISNMTAYLGKVKEMGFNAVWINPIQTAGNVPMVKRDKATGVRADNNVTSSLYAMSDTETISPYFTEAALEDSKEDAQKKDGKALRNFTDAARANGLVPMFDLVLNHVSSTAPIGNEKDWWFKGIDPSFKDAMKFDYSDPDIRKEILENFWKPYIYKYMVEYGFDGVRVDAVGYIDPDLRKEIYEYIYELAKIHEKPTPVILDEALFSGDVAGMTQQLMLNGDYAPSHITTGAYYVRHRGYDGSLPSHMKTEEKLKSDVVFKEKNGQFRSGAKGGCINFTGNHDHNSLAMTVLQEMAHERLEKNDSMNKLSKKLNEHHHEDEGRESIFLYSFVKDIEKEVKTGIPQATKIQFEKKMREKIAVCALTSSGGWFALSGDETGDLDPKSVFHRTRAPSQDYYPQREHKIFRDKSVEPVINEVLMGMAREIIQKDPEEAKAHMKEAYDDLFWKPEQERLLRAYIETLKIQINSGDPKICREFEEAVHRHGVGSQISINFTENDYISCVRDATNGWNGILDTKNYMKEINHILQELPASTMGCSTEIFKLEEKPDLFICVRKTGDNKTDIIVVNIDPNKSIEFTAKDLHNIACFYQHRVLTNSKYDTPEWHETYRSIHDAGLIHSGQSVILSPDLSDRQNQVKMESESSELPKDVEKAPHISQSKES